MSSNAKAEQPLSLYCGAARESSKATLLRHGDLLNRSKFQYFQSNIFSFIGKYSIPNNSLYYFIMTL
jgi:hypothetical protein